MKIILLDNIEKLGNVGSEVVVKPGYARNFLIPQSKAVLATKKNVEIFKKQQLILQSKVTDRQVQAESLVAAINKLDSITITSRSSIEGKLFGSIGPRDIAKLVSESVGFKISKSQIRLPNNGVLKSVGVYTIKIHIYNGIFANLNVIILNTLSKNTALKT